VPHEISTDHLQDLATKLESAQLSFIRLSECKASPPNFQVLVVDRMGILANLYGLASVAFVGGSFGPGVHKRAGTGCAWCMILFGPRHRNSHEAIQLTQNGGGRMIRESEELNDVYR